MRVLHLSYKSEADRHTYRCARDPCNHISIGRVVRGTRAYTGSRWPACPNPERDGMRACTRCSPTRYISSIPKAFLGSVKDLASVCSALQGVYGAFVNTDGFTIGEKEEVFAGLRIYEIAKQLGVKHYVWSNLDYVSKASSRSLR